MWCSLKPTQLRKRAAAAGLDDDQIEEAEDGETPRESLIQSLIELILAASAATATDGAAAAPAAREPLRAELASLRPTQLRKRAVAAGVLPEQMEEAEDGDTPKESLIKLVLAMVPSEGAATATALAVQASEPARKAAALGALRAELAVLRPMQLRKRAVAADVDSKQIEAAEDDEAPKQALIELILASAPVPVEDSKSQQPHHQLKKSASVDLTHAVIPNGKHAMLSYQWCVPCRPAQSIASARTPADAAADPRARRHPLRPLFPFVRT